MKALHLCLATLVGVAIPAVAPTSAFAEPCGPNVNSQSNPNNQDSVHPPAKNVPWGRMPPGTQKPTDITGDTSSDIARVTAAATLSGWVTGPSSPNQINQRFGISGTDLGIMWDNGQFGADKQILMAFGDTFGNCNLPGQEWRKNVLLRSGDTNLADGISIPHPVFGDVHAGSPVNEARPNFSKQIIESLNTAPTEITVIPTAGISVGTTQYINFMSVRQWGTPGQWTTNFSAIAVSTDNGENWSVSPQTVRFNSGSGVPGVTVINGNSNFQMTALVRKSGYVYTFGTPSGRSGPARVARVPEGAILDLAAYEYWNGTSWVLGEPAAASNIFSAPVSEMSVQWNDFLGRYIALYTTGSGVIMRTANSPEGPWSGASVIMSANAVPGGIYAPYIHPWSSGNALYFTLSLWSQYNVMLMRTTLTPSPLVIGGCTIIDNPTASNHTDCRGKNLSNVDLHGLDLRFANFSGANLKEANLSGTDLSGADLTNANLTAANLEAANLTNANLTKTKTSNTIVDDADLTWTLVNPTG